MLFDQFSERESRVGPAHQEECAAGSGAGTLEAGLGRGIEGELNGLILCLTFWVPTSRASSPFSLRHEN
jgi:hypothetical protein